MIGNDGSLWRIDEKRYKEKEGLIYIPPFSVPEHGNQIYSIALDQYNNEWVLTNRGHWIYGKNKLSGKRKFIKRLDGMWNFDVLYLMIGVINS